MSFLDDFERHELYLQRIATALLTSKIYPSLAEAYKAARLILLDAESIKSPSELNKITAAVRKATEETTAEAWAAATEELQSMGVYEAGFYAALVGGYADKRLKNPADKQIKGFIDKSLMTLHSGSKVDSGFWGEYVSAQIMSVGNAYDSAVKAGYSNGETVSQIAGRIRMVSEGLLKNEAESLARTGVQHYAAQARRVMSEANADVITREFPVVTFDNRTTPICMGIASKYPKGWPKDENPVGYPPYHFGCRTAIVDLVAGQDYPDGTRAAVGGQSDGGEAFEKKQNRTDKKFKYRGKKDQDVFNAGQIPAGTNIDTWLRSQPDWYIQSTLGPTKAKLFKDGGMRLSKFTDATQRPLTIAELRELDSAAFKRAGL